MPARWNPFTVRGRRGTFGPEELRTVKPGYRRMRSGGRAEVTVFTKTPAKSRDAIQRTWNSFSRETSAHREVFFKHIFNELTPAQLRSLRRMGTSVDGVVEMLSRPSSDRNYQQWLQKILSHSKVIDGTKVAADRFFLKNVSGVLLKAAKARKGFFNFTPGSAKDDVATGLLAALEHHGLARGEPELPPVSEPEGDEGAQPPVVSEPPEIPVVSEPPEVSGSDETPPGTSGSSPELTSLLEQHLQPREILIAPIAHAGVRLHGPSARAFEGMSEGATKGAISTLLQHSAQFIGHLWATDLIDRKDTRKLVNTALHSGSLAAFHTGMRVLLRRSDATSPVPALAALSAYQVPRGHKLFVRNADGTLRQVRGASLHNYERLLAGKDKKSAVSLTQEQKQAAAFHLLGTLAKYGHPSEAGRHLHRFILHTKDSVDTDVKSYYEMQEKNRKLSSSDALSLLYNLSLHGNVNNDTLRLILQRHAGV